VLPLPRKFAGEGFAVFDGRRRGEKLAALVAEVEAAGGRIVGRSLDARKEEEVTAFLQDADMTAPLEPCVFNAGANVNFPLLETTERLFRKVWKWLPGRSRGGAPDVAARPRQHLLYGATAGLRAGVGYAAFASAKFGLRAVAQSAAREIAPRGIHVAHLVIDAGVDTAWVRERIREREGEAALTTSTPAG
jgi:NAD(P)-dependent dehydrogenase (short-subunit alcohol dehydrogenase family)